MRVNGKITVFNGNYCDVKGEWVRLFQFGSRTRVLLAMVKKKCYTLCDVKMNDMLAFFSFLLLKEPFKIHFVKVKYNTFKTFKAIAQAR